VVIPVALVIGVSLVLNQRSTSPVEQIAVDAPTRASNLGPGAVAR
jgi:hypothetical protein